MGHDVFISYSSHDRKVADTVCALIEQRGYRCWIAPRDILPGREWGEAIIDGIRGARVFVLIFSASANRSPQVNREVERAVGHGLPIVPFRIENVAPSDSLEYFISNQHWLDALTPPLTRHINQLGDVVGRLLGSGTPPPPASPGTAKPPKPPGVGVAAGAAMGIALAAFVAGVTWLLWNAHAPPPPEATAASVTKPASSQQQPAPAPPPAPRDENLLDFPPVGPDVSAYAGLEAQPYLRNAAVRVRIVELSAAGGELAAGRLFFTSSGSLGMLEGFTLPGPTRTVLVYQRNVNADAIVLSTMVPPRPLPPAVPNFAVLEFEEPVAQVSFSMPAVQPANGFSGVTIRAYTASGEEIQNATRDPVSSNNPAPPQTVTLTGWARQGIRRIRFEPYSLSGGRFGERVGFLIEGITVRRMAGPAT